MSQRGGAHYGLLQNGDRDGVTQGYINNDAIDRKISMIHDLAFDLSHDPEIVRLLAAVSRAKDEAVKGMF